MADREQKINDRKARFGNDAKAKLEKGDLEFSLDEYKSDKSKSFNRNQGKFNK